MAERVRDRLQRLPREEPSIEVRFTDGITVDSYLHGVRSGRPVLFLHPSHREFVDELRGRSDGP